MPIAVPADLPRFASLDAWQATTYVAVGERVTNDGGKIYVCDVAGTTAGAGGPTGVGANIVDGTARWDYVAANAPAWVTLTAYALGNRVTNDGGKVYQCLQAGTSGAAPGPTGADPTVTLGDGTCLWIYTADSEAQVTTPSAGQLDVGWIPGQRPPAQYFNWLFWVIYRWLLWLSQYTGEVINAARVDRTNTFTEPQIIDADPEGAGIATALLDLQTTAVDFAKMLQFSEQAAGAVHPRWYVAPGGGVIMTVNAQWDPVGLLWVTDNAAAGAQRWAWGANFVQIDTHAAAISWADGAWSSQRLYFDPITGDLSIVGTLAADSGVETNAGDVKALAGNVRAEGDPDTGEARVYAKEIISEGAAPTAANAGGAGGAGFAINAISGNSMKGLVSFITGAAPAGGAPILVTRDKDYPAIPVVHLCPAVAGGPAGEELNAAACDWAVGIVAIGVGGNTTFQISITGATIAAGTDYGFAYHVVG